MEKQSFNIREKYSGFLLGTIQVTARTDARETAIRLNSYVQRKYGKDITSNYILNA